VDATASVPVTHWLPRGREACGSAVFRATAFALRELAQFIGVPYPWQRYGHVVVHRFLWGGMENTTLTTISDRVLATAAEQQREDVDVDSLVIHELVHQWFGDLLTMKGWSDIWLNESFATYLEARITARWRAAQGVASEADALAHELWRNRSAYLEQHDGRYRRALVTNRWDDAYELFDRVAYEQGSLVLHTLASWLGEARFHAALQLYTSRHAHDLVETADFRQAIEDATGEPADWFFDQWVFRPGHAALTVTWSHSPARQHLVVTITQTEPCFRLHLAVAAAGLPEQQVEITAPSHTLVFAASTAPAWVAVDPRGEILATISENTVQPALIADPQAPAHARARACATAGSKHPTPALRAAVIAAAGLTSPVLVREQAIEALAAWRLAEPLLALYPQVAERERRVVVAALGRFRDAPEAAAIATQLVAWADTTASDATAGDCLAARGALEVPGATPLLRARLGKPGWNHRRLAGAVRGLGAAAEPAALDEILRLATDPTIPDPVLPLVAGAIGNLGARLPLARERSRRVLEPLVAHELMTVRVAAAKALATLGDPAARTALSTQRAREGFGNVRRVQREALHALDQVAATTAATAELTRRISDLESARTKLEQRLVAIEKQFAGPG
jgi:aminopeptidase N